MDRFDDIYQRSLADPSGFWAEAAQAITWSKPWDKVIDGSAKPFYKWFAGGELNTCYNALDRHVENDRAEQIALIYDSPVTDTIGRYSYRELRDQVARFAGVLKAQGIAKGDRVMIYLPMVPEALISMLACARLGAIHCVVFSGFAAQELATRLNGATPKLVISASCGIEVNRIVKYKPLLDQAIALASHKPTTCIILQRPMAEADMIAGRDLDWDDVMVTAQATECVPVYATDPLYILYTSGTTGQPKAVVRDNGGHAVALAWSMRYIYNIKPSEVYWAASDVGGVVGHSYIVYAPLLYGCTTVLYEGEAIGTPDPGAFWRVISQHKVSTLFTAPTAFRAIKKEDPNGRYLKTYNLTSLQTLFLAGERSDPDTLNWAERMLCVPVIDHWWQTETGWSIAANCLGIEPLPIKQGSPTRAVPGYDVRVLDDSGQEAAIGTMGNIVIKLPLPPSCLTTLWKNDERFKQTYLSTYPGYFLTGDAGYKDTDQYLWIMSRIDDVINVAGHRLATGAMEEVLASHPDVAECAVIGAKDQLKGQRPIGLVVLKTGVERDQTQISQELVQRVRQQIGPVAAFKTTLIVQRLPKTRSGKILRGTMKKIADGETINMPAIIDEPAILDEIAAVLRQIGHPPS